MAVDLSPINTDKNYANSQDFNFTPTPSPIPGQRAAYDTFNKDFTGFLGSQETVPQLTARYQGKFNIPFLQNLGVNQGNQLADLGYQMQAIPQNIGSETSNSLLTAGQKANLIASKQAPLQLNYGRLATSLGQTENALNQANTNLNTMVTAEQAQQMKMLQPWLQKYDAMTIQNAAENANWTTSNQMELDRLLANQAAGVQLSEGQQSRMEQLAQAELQFENNLKVAEVNKSSALGVAQVGNQYKTLTPTQTLVNTFTGGTYRAY